LFQQPPDPLGADVLQYRGTVAPLDWWEPRGGGADRFTSFVVRFVLDGDASSAQLLLEIADRHLDVLDLETDMRRRMVAEPGLLLEQHGKPATMLREEVECHRGPHSALARIADETPQVARASASDSIAPINLV
jgi:hypothetical protein